MDGMHLVLACSDGKRWERTVSAVTLPGEQGSLGVLRGHAPLLCALREGTLSCRSESGESWRFRVSEGIARVADDEVTVLLRYMEPLEE